MAVAAPSYVQPALKQDDDFRIPNLNLTKIALGMAPAFGQ